MNNRYDFIYLFDTKDANPNGDPDAGNLPRVDAETGHGLITDVCLKRKVRNFVSMIKDFKPPHDIYIKEKAVLEDAHKKAYQTVNQNAEAKEGKRKGTGEEVEKARVFMCQNFYDIRTFGAVMSLAINCGQVRGPVQIGFSRSIDPVVVSEHAITRMAVATQREAEAQQGDNRTMGRKFTIPYALYRAHGFVNPYLANQTKFSEGTNCGEPKGDDGSDLELLFQALEQAFQFDQSAARPAGSMAPRGLLVFKHNSALGNAASHDLFDRLVIKSFEEEASANDKPARSFEAYSNRITFDGKPLDEVVKRGDSIEVGNGITLIRRI